MNEKTVDLKRKRIRNNPCNAAIKIKKIIDSGMNCKEVANLLGIRNNVLSRIINGATKSKPVIEFIEGLPDSLKRVGYYQNKMIKKRSGAA